MPALDSPLVIYLTVFVAVTLLFNVVGAAYMRYRNRSSRISSRLTRLSTPQTVEDLRDLLVLENGPEDAAVHDIEVSKFNVVQIHKQSGLSTPLFQLAVYAFFGGVLLSLCTLYFMNFSIVHLFIAVMLGGVLLLWYLRRARAKRCDAFAEQLPDAIDVAIRSLKAGHPFVGSLALVAEEMPDPVGTEFGLLADQLGYGSRVEDALQMLRSRVPAEDLRYLTLALVIHEKSGGNLTNTLRTLAEVIRQRQALAGKVRALSAEGRFTAKLMSVFPLIIYGVLTLISPGYFDDLWELGYKQHFFVFCIAMTVVGNFFINKMVKLEV